MNDIQSSHSTITSVRGRDLPYPADTGPRHARSDNAADFSLAFPCREGDPSTADLRSNQGNSMTTAVTVDAVRLASGKGKPGGTLSGTHPVETLAHVLRAVVDRNDLDPALIDDVIGGCVQQVGEQALNISRTATLATGFPESAPATTIDRQCGSSQQAAHFAAAGVVADAYDIVIACGVESMSRVPMGTSPIGQYTAGPSIAARYPQGLVNRGISAELIAAKWKLDRETLDAFSAESHRRASHAAANGLLEAEILPIAVRDKEADLVPHQVDETVRAATTAHGLSGLKSLFRNAQYAQRFPEIGWHITPGNSSPLTDGASAVLIMSEQAATKLGLTPRARFHSFAVADADPLFMLTAPIPATKKVLAKSGLSIDDIDAYEVNEAFAPVPLMWAHEFGADPARLNPRGGAIALGHALGSSGTRLLTTLVNQLEATGGRYGLQTMCESAGLANATVIERLKCRTRSALISADGLEPGFADLSRPRASNPITRPFPRGRHRCNTTSTKPIMRRTGRRSANFSPAKLSRTTNGGRMSG